MHLQYYEYSIQLAYSNALMTMYCTVVVIVHLDCGRTKADGRFGMFGSAWNSRSVRNIRNSATYVMRPVPRAPAKERPCMLMLV